MKVVILAGGQGTRLAEETETRPKPMVEIGGYPIIWHIMKHYGRYGFREFVIALGYKGELIKRFFIDFATLNGDLTVHLGRGSVDRHSVHEEAWTIHLIDTGKDSQTGGRIGRLAPLLGRDCFMLTYGDGVSNLDLGALLAFHRRHGKLATITAVRPPSRFGGLDFEPGRPVRFTEKPQMGEGWINGGFMVLEPEVLDRIEGDQTNFEAHVLEQLGVEGELMGFPHDDFWQCCDTLRDLRFLRALWDEGKAPWATWT
jgi:glucose-1-phosphate cytidylyltransferase